MPMVWDGPAKERLFAATMAAGGSYPSAGLIAKYYGEEVTYDAVEGQIRKIKKLAKELAQEAAANGAEVAKPERAIKRLGGPGSGSGSTARGKKRTNNGRPKAASTKNAVIGGRVSKSKSTSKSLTPTATRKQTKLEHDHKDVKMESDIDDLMEKDSTDEAFSLQSFDGSVDDWIS